MSAHEWGFVGNLCDALRLIATVLSGPDLESFHPTTTTYLSKRVLGLNAKPIRLVWDTETDEITWTADADLVEVSGHKFSYVNVHSRYECRCDHDIPAVKQ